MYLVFRFFTALPAAFPAQNRWEYRNTFPDMRYFAELAYNGTAFEGWQRQKQESGQTVQQTIEQAFSLMLRQEIAVTGCGRTDSGVHARQYFLHFDFDGEFPPSFIHRLNKFLPPEIAFFRIFPVAPESHARFDAIERSYRYELSFWKDPFRPHMVYHFRNPTRPNYERMQEAAALLMNYREFFPFCKSDNDAHTMRCDLRQAEWTQSSPNLWSFHITSDRFLRGMVRLIVGMCLNVGLGKIELAEVRDAMDRQTHLRRAESAPPDGLSLVRIEYEENVFRY